MQPSRAEPPAHSWRMHDLQALHWCMHAHALTYTAPGLKECKLNRCSPKQMQASQVQSKTNASLTGVVQNKCKPHRPSPKKPHWHRRVHIPMQSKWALHTRTSHAPALFKHFYHTPSRCLKAQHTQWQQEASTPMFRL